MTPVYGFLIFFIVAAILEGITIGVILTPWGQKKIVRQVLRRAKLGHKVFNDVLNEIKRDW